MDTTNASRHILAVWRKSEWTFDQLQIPVCGDTFSVVGFVESFEFCMGSFAAIRSYLLNLVLVLVHQFSKDHKIAHHGFDESDQSFDVVFGDIFASSPGE